MAKLKICNDFAQGDAFFIKISHVPVEDVTGDTFEFIMKDNESDAAPGLHITYTPGTNPDDDETNGIIYIPVTSVLTDALLAGRYHGVIRKTSDGLPLTILRTGRDDVDHIRVFRKLD